MFRSIRVPFQFKVYVLFFALFFLLLQLITHQVRSLVTDQILKNESVRFEDLRTLFQNFITTKTRSLRNESLLLAGQIEVRRTLEMLNQGDMIQSFLRHYYPSDHPHNFLIFTDQQGEVLDGFVSITQSNEDIWIEDTQELKSIIGTIPAEIMKTGEPAESFVSITVSGISHLFSISTVPVLEIGLNPNVIGTVTLGFEINSELAVSLQRNSPFEIGFVSGRTPLISSLTGTHHNTFRRIWFTSLEGERSTLLLEPQIIEVDNTTYLAYASYMQLDKGNEKVLYVIFTSLDETLDVLHYLDQSMISMSVMFLSGMLIVGYLLARRVTAPVRRLVHNVGLLSEGHYNIDTSVRSNDELQTLGESIQILASKLHMREIEAKKYVQQIEEWNRELESKVSERTKELEDKNLTLKATSKELEKTYNRIDEELQIVGELQKKLLPQSGFEMEGLNIQSYYSPNGRAGGDYFDFIQTGPNTIYCLIGDVAGHGTAAAFIMGITRTIAHSLIQRRQPPQSILLQLSEQLYDTTRRGEFVTMFLARFDLESNTLTYSVAGQTPPFFYCKESETITELQVDKGLPLGIIDNPEYEEVTIAVQEGDRLLMYTDGIVEGFNPAREAYGEERLKEQMMNAVQKSPQEFLNDVIHDLGDFVQHPLDVEPLDDDVTLVCVDFMPQSAFVPYV